MQLGSKQALLTRNRRRKQDSIASKEYLWEYYFAGAVFDFSVASFNDGLGPRRERADVEFVWCSLSLAPTPQLTSPSGVCHTFGNRFENHWLEEAPSVHQTLGGGDYDGA